MARLPTRLLGGKPYPLGANWDGLGVNFAVFSAHAERVELCLFDQAGRRELSRIDLPDCTDEVFHGYQEGARPGLVYGYRVHGPYQPEAGHRFNPNKLLLDPYARKLVGAVRWSDALFGYRIGGAREDLSFDRRDSAAAMPKAVVVDPAIHWGDDAPPGRAWADTVIYETHVRGLTIRHPRVAEHARGSFAGLADPAVLEHLVKLGVTAVELLPVQAFLRDRFLVEKGLTNYWGYSTLGFFAPEPAYLAATDGALNEVRMAVRRLHAAGIEVILDVVYNHTCEGNETGPTLSWRGFDNASYYRLTEAAPRRCVDDTGTGNTLNLAHPRVLQMVMDSLRHWVEAYHVDGVSFRPRHHAGARGGRLRSVCGILRCAAAGPGAGPAEADRRALGHRPGRLSARQFSARLHGVERPVPGHRAAVLARRCRAAGRAGIAADGLL